MQTLHKGKLGAKGSLNKVCHNTHTNSGLLVGYWQNSNEEVVNQIQFKICTKQCNRGKTKVISHGALQ